MKRISIFYLFLLLFGTASAQNIYEATDFSDKYYGKIFIEEPDQVFSPGWIAIYDKQTDIELIRIESEELAANFTEDDKIKTNVQELPYGEQSLIICDDFNCDGINDLAIQDGQNSCYHGPSYIIYLSENGKFVENAEFTRLAQEYCGMPAVDCSEKRIYTMTKSGCCWHQYQTYSIEGGLPKLIEEIEEYAMNFPFAETTVRTWLNGKMEEKTTNTLNASEADIVFTFEIIKNRKKVFLVNSGDRLVYCLEKSDGDLEFIYPNLNDEEVKNFTYKIVDGVNCLSFSNDDAQYSIYNANNKVGIKVVTGGKTYDMPGTVASRKGFLSKEGFAQFDNVVK